MRWVALVDSHSVSMLSKYIPFQNPFPKVCFYEKKTAESRIILCSTKSFPPNKKKNVFKFAKNICKYFCVWCILNMVTVINVASESGIIQTAAANQRPVYKSRDLSRPIRGQYLRRRRRGLRGGEHH